MKYDYNRCCSEMEEFVDNNPEAEIFSVGESVMEQKIFCIKYGRGNKKILLNGAHHGLEYITSAFLMRFLREYAKSVEENSEFFGHDTKPLFDNVELYVIPMVNPDGVDIALNGLNITNRYHRKLISMVGIHSFNRVWQANANGVDLNHNYDANWQVVKTEPGSTKYSGPYPESEPETKAVCGLVKSEDFDMLMAFHSQGQEIYYDFDGLAYDKDYIIAQKMADESGYAVKNPVGSASFGGCKDWFIKEFGASGFTVEMGIGENPLDVEKLDSFFDENAKIVLTAMEEVTK